MTKIEIQKIKRAIVPVLKKNGVVSASIFGSVARSEAKKASDIDILVKFKGGKSLLDLIGLEIQLEKKIKRKVDVLTYDSIHPLIRDRILEEQVKIL